MSKILNGEPLHIGIFGRRKSGKSSLIHMLTGRKTTSVLASEGIDGSDENQTEEIQGLGVVRFIDTAGFDQTEELNYVVKTADTVGRCDIAIVVFDGTEANSDREFAWVIKLRDQQIPVLTVLNKKELCENPEEREKQIELETGLTPIGVSALTGEGREALLSALVPLIPADFGTRTITGNLCGPGDSVLLVMHQDVGVSVHRPAPQFQVLRELLRKKCIVVSVTAEEIAAAVEALKDSPKLIITDSQAFAAAYAFKPIDSVLTSFSILFGAYKGDIDVYLEGVRALDQLNSRSKVLIAETCTDAMVPEEVGCVKIPNMLRNKFGKKIQVDVTCGTEFPENLKDYDLIIHCGGCMFTRRHVLNRINQAVEQNVPITNYGIFMAKMNGILNKIFVR